MIILEFITIILTSVIAVYELNSNGHLDKKGKIAMGLIVFLAVTNVASQIFSYKKEKQKETEEMTSKQQSDSINQDRFLKSLSELEEINKKLVQTNTQNGELIQSFITQNIKLKNISTDLSKVSDPLEPHKLQLTFKVNIAQYLRTNPIKELKTLQNKPIDTVNKVLSKLFSDPRHSDLRSFLIDRTYGFSFTSNSSLKLYGKNVAKIGDYSIYFDGDNNYTIKVVNDTVIGVLVKINKYEALKVRNTIKSLQDVKDCILQIHNDPQNKSNKKNRLIWDRLEREIKISLVALTFNDKNETDKTSLFINKTDLQKNYISNSSDRYYEIKIKNLPSNSWQVGSVDVRYE